jgi:carboxyvinyl-carboxyphosphonate phosphorylmutase
LFFTGVKTPAQLQAIAAATTLPILLGSPTKELADWDFLAGQRVRIAVQGHAPIAAAIQAVHTTLQAIREGTAPNNLQGLAASDLIERVTRQALVRQRGADFLGLKR